MRTTEAILLDLVARSLRQVVKGNHEAATRLRQKAIRTGKRLMQIDPSPSLWILLGDVYTQRQKKMMCYWRALKLDPTNSEANFEYARSKLDMGVSPRRLAAYVDRAMIGPPEHIKYQLFDFARNLYRQLGRRADAHRANRRLNHYKKKNRVYLSTPICRLDPDWFKPDDGKH